MNDDTIHGELLCAMSRSRRTKVFWSEPERALVIRRAVAIQSERPDMAGLPLLREAMLALPPGRRRKLIAVSQAAWFEDGMKTEVKRIADEAKLRDPFLQVVQANGRRLESHHQTMEEWKRADAEWKADVLDKHRQTIAILSELLFEMRALNVILKVRA